MRCAACCAAVVCGRRMQGSWNNGKPYYRCVFLSDYAAKNKVAHPPAVYLREDLVLPHLDAWLARKFSPAALPGTIRELDAAAQPGQPKPDRAAQREINDCDAKLARYRAALEAGADPALVTGWINEAQAKRTLSEARLRKSAGQRRMTREEITSVVTALSDLLHVLEGADPADKAAIYSRLALTLTYHPEDKRVVAELRPKPDMCVEKCPRPELNLLPIFGALRTTWQSAAEGASAHDCYRRPGHAPSLP